jgi:carbamoyltransferase
MRIGPRHPRLAAAGYRLMAPVFEWFYTRQGFHHPTSKFATDRIDAVRAKLDRGETAYVAGVGVSGNHNSGVALVELTRAGGARLICNNEEERFSGKKHSTEYPRHAIDCLLVTLQRLGLGYADIDAWVSTWDYSLLSATWLRVSLEEAPASLSMLLPHTTVQLDAEVMRKGLDAPKVLGKQLGFSGPVPIIRMQHHQNHAWFSYCASPFTRSDGPVIVAVIDGMGDRAAVTLYVVEKGRLREFYCNESLFDSLGFFYSIISSSQGGWTMLSSEGRYMGAAAYGNQDRKTNPYYAPLSKIFSLEPQGQVHLNRSLANWHRKLYTDPYTSELSEILGPPIAIDKMWNPDAVLKVDNIQHSKITQERLDKAAATQMVFEDALFHILDYAIKETGSDQLVLSGGVALNALANMRVLDRFGETYYRRELDKETRLNLWIPPAPGDAGVTIGAAYMFAYLAGVGVGKPLEHAFYCGPAPTAAEISEALDAAPDVVSLPLGDISTPEGRDAIADLMAYVAAQDGVLAILQGPGETGPRALGHRSILANPCNPETRQVLNDRVKYREAIRPLAPMMTLSAARQFFELSDGGAADDYNAYNYMVLTAQAKPEARARIPAVVHADGTGRIQIVRENTDPLIHAYLKALGRRIGVEVAVNTSFNVGGPIVQTPVQAVATLRRSKGMDAVLMIAEDGTAFAAWLAASQMPQGSRFPVWFDEWKAKSSAPLVPQA